MEQVHVKLFYYLQLVHLIRGSLCPKENTIKTEKVEKINAGRDYYYPGHKTEFPRYGKSQKSG